MIKSILTFFVGLSIAAYLPTFCLNAFSNNPAGSSTPIKRFEDQVVIVTGASRGIGKSIACLFAEEGAKLVLVGRDETQLKTVQNIIQEKGAEVIYIQADVSNPKDMEKLTRITLKQHDQIDVLCHNAGIYPQARLENMSLEQWQK